MELSKRSPAEKIAFLTGIAMSISHIYMLGFRPTTPWIMYNVHLAFGAALAFMTYPLSKARKDKGPSVLDWVAIALTAATCAYMVHEMEGLIYRIGVAPTTLDLVFSGILLVVVLEATRRTTGEILPVIAVISLLYARFGYLLPGVMGHRGYDWSRIISYMSGLDAIFSVSLGASAQYVFLLLLFSAFLNSMGTGQFFLDFASGLAGHRKGGPAKIAIVSSAFFGTISGNSVANVVSTGIFSIPLMKKCGYQPGLAGAVEAVASTGGQIMPPIMGSAAFIMAQLLGVTYLKVAQAALIPAILYFASLMMMIGMIASKQGLSGVSRDELPSVRKVLRGGWYLVLPVATLLFVMVQLRASVIRASLWAILAAIAVAVVSSKGKYGIRDMLGSLYDGARQSVGIVASCACAGIVVGVLSLTGAGLRFAQLVVALSGGHLLPALALTAIASLILGMGLPTTACYLISAAVSAPALIELGVQPMAAHMFVFYYACLSAITPPVALAVYAAAGIAKAKFMDVAWSAVRLGAVAYIVPFMFAYGPSLLAQGDLLTVVWSLFSALVGVYALGMGIVGWCGRRQVGWLARALLIAAALSLIKPGLITDLFGFSVIAVVMILTELHGRRQAARSVSQ